MFKQTLFSLHSHVCFYSSSSLLVLKSEKAYGNKSIQVFLTDNSFFSLKDEENDNTSLVLNKINEGVEQILLVFRDEKDAQSMLELLEYKLRGGKSIFYKIQKGLKLILTGLITVVVLLALMTIWKGYASAQIAQQNLIQKQNKMQQTENQYQKSSSLGQQINNSTNQGGLASLTPAQLQALQSQLERGAGSAPSQAAPSAPAPEATPPPAPVSPGDAVAKGLEGN